MGDGMPLTEAVQGLQCRGFPWSKGDKLKWIPITQIARHFPARRLRPTSGWTPGKKLPPI
jgi:hypothetical protein